MPRFELNLLRLERGRVERTAIARVICWERLDFGDDVVEARDLRGSATKSPVWIAECSGERLQILIAFVGEGGPNAIPKLASSSSTAASGRS
jgi:hypothetical protein